MIKVKCYRCEKCGRPINHRGNCLKCNLVKEYERVSAENLNVPGFTDILVDEILKIESIDHKALQAKIRNILKRLGCIVELEKKIKARRNGRIDLFATKDNFSIGIEIDHSSMRLRSIDKLNTLRPDLAIFVLKSQRINKRNLYLRRGLIKVNSLVVCLAQKRTKKLGII